MKKLHGIVLAVLAIASMCAFVAPAKADSFVGLVVAPKQNIGTMFQHSNTDVGVSVRILKLGVFDVSPVALYDDQLGIRYGGVLSLHIASHTSVGIGATIDYKTFTLNHPNPSTPFLALTVRL
jgi:hypothetical protein